MYAAYIITRCFLFKQKNIDQEVPVAIIISVEHSSKIPVPIYPNCSSVPPKNTIELPIWLTPLAFVSSMDCSHDIIKPTLQIQDRINKPRPPLLMRDYSGTSIRNKPTFAVLNLWIFKLVDPIASTIYNRLMDNLKSVVIFDFDGVIAISDDTRFKILKEQALHYNVVVPDSLYKETIGQTTVDFFQKHFSHLNPDTTHSIIENYTKIYRGNILQYSKEVDPVTSFIKKHSTDYVFAIASTNTIVNIRAVLKKFGIINHFSCIVTREDVLKKKPNPSAYLKVIDKLSAHKSQCIAVEDSAIGAKAAINAGIPVLGLLNGSNTAHDFGSLPLAGIVSTEAELADAIQSTLVAPY